MTPWPFHGREVFLSHHLNRRVLLDLADKERCCRAVAIPPIGSNGPPEAILEAISLKGADARECHALTRLAVP